MTRVVSRDVRLVCGVVRLAWGVVRLAFLALFSWFSWCPVANDTILCLPPVPGSGVGGERVRDEGVRG